MPSFNIIDGAHWLCTVYHVIGYVFGFLCTKVIHSDSDPVLLF